jgi:hypothetical protein
VRKHLEDEDFDPSDPKYGDKPDCVTLDDMVCFFAEGGPTESRLLARMFLLASGSQKRPRRKAKTGEHGVAVSFVRFVIAVWNFCTLTPENMHQLAFDLFFTEQTEQARHDVFYDIIPLYSCDDRRKFQKDQASERTARHTPRATT